LVAFLSKQLAVSRSDFIIILGETSHFKVIQVRGNGQQTVKPI